MFASSDKTSTYSLGPARYANGKIAVRCPSSDGYKTRAACLAERISNGRYSGRGNSYIMSPSAAERFERLFAAGWDASPFSGDFIAPNGARCSKLPTKAQEAAFVKPSN